MGSWNGLDLQSEFSTDLSDTSISFKAKVLTWINDIQTDICARYEWPFMRVKGKKILTASVEQHDLTLGQPTAPTIALSSGGSLTEDSVYTVLITFYESISKIESIAGVASSSVTATAANATIDVSVIPVSSDSLVTARKVYLVKDSGEPLLVETISDNTTTTSTITSDTSSTIEAPDYSYFDKLSGEPFFESTSSRYLNYQPIDQLRLLFQGTWASGTPQFWSDIAEESIVLYPVPSTALTLSYYYFKMPTKIFAEATSKPTIPAWLKPVLKAGVLAMGYEHRDRAGAQIKMQNYETLIRIMISKHGKNKKSITRVRDTQGDSDGWAIV